VRKSGLAAKAGTFPALRGQAKTHVASEGGLVMRPIDFTPLYRSTVGFDRLFNLLVSVSGF
jgi:hypothetical protein